MKKFFKYVFATFVGLTLFSLFSLIFLVVIISIFSPDEPEVKENSVLRLNLDRRIVERETDDFFAQLSRPLSGTDGGSIGLLELRRSIKNAATNNNIKGILLDINGLDIGMAMLEELREELIGFKESGKFIVAYAEIYSEGAYYLSSVADKVFLPRSGYLEFNGLSSEVLFFKNMLQKLELEPEIFKVGDYKAAVEPLTMEHMSEANREQTTMLLESIYRHMLDNIAQARDLDATRLRALSDSLLIRQPDDALRYGLITDVAFFNDAEAYMRQQMQLEEKTDLEYVPYRYLIGEIEEGVNSNSGQKIAVIYAVGDIRDGKGDDRTIGSETMAEEIRKARRDNSVKAIVLRVNSPGGSAIASDVIWSEVKEATKVKPVIASMSDVAASGGYYIVAACDTILAHPTTITGSIGVFGVLFNGKNFLNNKLGITTDRVRTGPYADLGSFTRRKTDHERRIIQNEIEHVYGTFISVVAEGRSMDSLDVHNVGQGRVWAGDHAVNNRLVDAFGGLDEAVRVAAEKAQVTDYKVVYLPERKNLLMKLLTGQSIEEGKEALLEAETGDMYPYLQNIRKLKDLNKVQTRMPFELIIE